MKLSFINCTSRDRVRFGLASGIVALSAIITGSIADAQTTYTYYTGTSNAYMNASHWLTGGTTSTKFPGVDNNSSSTADGATNDIAAFGAIGFTATNGLGINFSTSNSTGLTANTGANGALTLGAFEFTSAATASFLIGNSAGTAGVLTLNGVTVNSVANSIISNEGTGTYTFAPANSGTTTTPMTIALGNATNNIIQTSNTGSIVISTAISGAGKNLTFQASNTGTLTLSGVNTFTGSFTASSGTTNLAIAGALGGATAVNIASGALVETPTTGLTGTINTAAAVTLNGTLDVSGGTETVSSLTGTSTGAFLTIGKSNTASGSFTVGDSTSTVFAGAIRDGTAGTGTTTFTKQGTGTLTLSNASTYSGTTSITNGKLLFTTATGSGTGTSAVSIGTSGTLASGAGTTGALTGLVTTVGTTSTIAPGATAGANTGTVGALTLSGGLNIAAGATIPFDLGSTQAASDLITTTTLTASTLGAGSVTFAFNNTGAVSGTTYELIGYTTGVSVLPSDFSATGATGVFSVMNNQVDFTFGTSAVPEPATVLGGALMVGAFGWSQRRRMKSGFAARRHTC